MPGPRAPQEARREQIMSAAYAVALRTGIDGVTLRAVAAEAKLSHGLVLFHFKQKDQLIGVLLDRVLATTAMLHPPPEIARLRRPADRLAELLHREMEHLARDPRGMRLFLEYWALGARDPAIREKVGAALRRYRAAFRALVDEQPTEPEAAGAGVAPEALAAVAISLISGCAVQAMIDPERFDTRAYAAAVHDIVQRLPGA